jgi:hypothetical protein
LPKLNFRKLHSIIDLIVGDGMNLIYPNEEIIKHLSSIIYAYIDYFGIEHKNIIEERFRNMMFLSYSNPDILRKYYEDNQGKENLGYIKDYLDLCEQENKNIQLEENKKILENESITAKEMLESIIEGNKDSNEMNGAGICFFSSQDNNLVFFPTIYLVNPCLDSNYRDRMLIHEINHCVKITHKLFGDKIILTSGLEQRSFNIYEEKGKTQLKYSENNFYTSFEERQLTEFLNDRISYEIYSRLKGNGVNILDDNNDIEVTKKWRRHINGLEEFFKDHEEAIKLSRLYGKPNLLLNEVGVSNNYGLLKLLHNKYGVEELLTKEQIDDFNGKQR